MIQGIDLAYDSIGSTEAANQYSALFMIRDKSEVPKYERSLNSGIAGGMIDSSVDARPGGST